MRKQKLRRTGAVQALKDENTCAGTVKGAYKKELKRSIKILSEKKVLCYTVVAQEK